MNKYPTIFVSFRQVEGLDFKGAYDILTVVISNLFNEYIYLLHSKKATEFQKTSFKNLLSGNASVKEVKSSIYLLMNMMNDYYNEPVILLIDEYDVPVVKANNNGYYNEMLDVMKSLMQTVKDNKTLKFAIITGCLRIEKESIFTGMNNFVSDTIVSSRLNGYFGFTQKEVNKILFCITKISTFLILCDLAVCLATLYVSFSLVFALMRYLQGKVFLIRFYSPTTLSSSRAEFRLPSRLACA